MEAAEVLHIRKQITKTFTQLSYWGPYFSPSFYRAELGRRERFRASDARAFWWRDARRRNGPQKDAIAKDATCNGREFLRILECKAFTKKEKLSP